MPFLLLFCCFFEPFLAARGGGGGAPAKRLLTKLNHFQPNFQTHTGQALSFKIIRRWLVLQKANSVALNLMSVPIVSELITEATNSGLIASSAG